MLCTQDFQMKINCTYCKLWVFKAETEILYETEPETSQPDVLTASFVGLLGGGLPAHLGHVRVEREDAVVLATVGAHLDEFTPSLHVGETVLR